MKDELLVLQAIRELPFQVGKKFLCEVLMGKETESITRNKINYLDCFGTLAYQESELKSMIEGLISMGLIEQKPIPGKRFFKVLHLTKKGNKELDNPTKEKETINFDITNITEEDKAIFKQFEFFLGNYDPEQKKAIISNKEEILCVAGAGSGKTTVLTKRIEFLTKFRSVPQEKILAITFTRKAKQEMENRLSKVGINTNIETFNSFCEKFLKRYNNVIYDKPVCVIKYAEKIKFVIAALKQQGKTIHQATNFYFSTAQKRFKTPEQLTAIFVNDCFTILDHYKMSNQEIEKFYERDELSFQEKSTAKIVYDVCIYIDENMSKYGKRDFSDQLVDCLKLFKNKDIVPHFDHILVDEYQDVNKIQIELIDVLNPDNLFCVGDPRQSIFGWRGSRIQYIVNFKDKYPNCEILSLVNNYRSSESIVKLMNESIKNMKLPDLKSNSNADKDISISQFSNEKEEHSFIVNQVLKSNFSRNEIFILGRTNKTLLKISDRLRMYDIPHLLRTDDQKKAILDKSNAITLATVHAIKGLEAEKVFIVGCNSRNFPCKSSDHPILDLIKLEEYDKHEEELRLFYVAISRAKKSLTISYSGTISYFITQDMMKQVTNSAGSTDIVTKLKNWRTIVAEKEKIAPYFILHDSTIEEIAAKKPSTLKELELINGIGPLKIMKYGKTILNEVS